MHKNKTKPDLMFLLTVFVCLGVLVTATVNASEAPQQGWAMSISPESDCQQTGNEWQACAGWKGLEETESQGTTVRFFHEQRPDLGVVWYYSQAFNDNNINKLHFDSTQGFLGREQSNAQFGLAVRQQYRHFGLSVGVESERALPLENSAVLYFGISNRW